MGERRAMQAVERRNEANRHDDFDGLDEIKRHDDAREPEDYNFDDFDEGRPTETWRLLADQLGPRIDELSRAVEGLRAAPYYVWLADTVHLCDPAGDLRVKVEALQWMFRIAKHLNGDGRIMVMATVSKSVDDLEVAVEAQLRANAVKVAA
jgi:hypothetical protein